MGRKRSSRGIKPEKKTATKVQPIPHKHLCLRTGGDFVLLLSFSEVKSAVDVALRGMILK